MSFRFKRIFYNLNIPKRSFLNYIRSPGASRSEIVVIPEIPFDTKTNNILLCEENQHRFLSSDLQADRIFSGVSKLIQDYESCYNSVCESQEFAHLDTPEKFSELSRTEALLCRAMHSVTCRNLFMKDDSANAVITEYLANKVSLCRGDIFSRTDIYAMLESLHADMKTESPFALKLLLQDFRHHGANLSPANRNFILENYRNLANNQHFFRKNVQITRKKFLLFYDHADLAENTPEFVLAKLRNNTASTADSSASTASTSPQQQQQHFQLNLLDPALVELFLRHCTNAQLRMQAWIAQRQVASHALYVSTNNNSPLIERIRLVRRSIAKRLGLANWTELIFDENGASSSESAAASLDSEFSSVSSQRMLRGRYRMAPSLEAVQEMLEKHRNVCFDSALHQLPDLQALALDLSSSASGSSSSRSASLSSAWDQLFLQQQFLIGRGDDAFSKLEFCAQSDVMPSPNQFVRRLSSLLSAMFQLEIVQLDHDADNDATCPELADLIDSRHSTSSSPIIVLRVNTQSAQSGATPLGYIIIDLIGRANKQNFAEEFVFVPILEKKSSSSSPSSPSSISCLLGNLDSQDGALSLTQCIELTHKFCHVVGQIVNCSQSEEGGRGGGIIQSNFAPIDSYWLPADAMQHVLLSSPHVLRFLFAPPSSSSSSSTSPSSNTAQPALLANHRAAEQLAHSWANQHATRYLAHLDTLYRAQFDIDCHVTDAHWLDVMSELWPQFHANSQFDALNEWPCSALSIFASDVFNAGLSEYAPVWRLSLARHVARVFRERGRMHEWDPSESSREGGRETREPGEELRDVAQRFSDTFWKQSGSASAWKMFQNFAGSDPNLGLEG